MAAGEVAFDSSMFSTVFCSHTAFARRMIAFFWFAATFAFVVASSASTSPRFDFRHAMFFAFLASQLACATSSDHHACAKRAWRGLEIGTAASIVAIKISVGQDKVVAVEGACRGAVGFGAGREEMHKPGLAEG